MAHIIPNVVEGHDAINGPPPVITRKRKDNPLRKPEDFTAKEMEAWEVSVKSVARGLLPRKQRWGQCTDVITMVRKANGLHEHDTLDLVMHQKDSVIFQKTPEVFEATGAPLHEWSKHEMQGDPAFTAFYKCCRDEYQRIQADDDIACQNAGFGDPMPMWGDKCGPRMAWWDASRFVTLYRACHPEMTRAEAYNAANRLAVSGYIKKVDGAHLLEWEFWYRMRYYTFTEIQTMLGTSCSPVIKRKWLNHPNPTPEMNSAFYSFKTEQDQARFVMLVQKFYRYRARNTYPDKQGPMKLRKPTKEDQANFPPDGWVNHFVKYARMVVSSKAELTAWEFESGLEINKAFWTCVGRLIGFGRKEPKPAKFSINEKRRLQLSRKPVPQSAIDWYYTDIAGTTNLLATGEPKFLNEDNFVNHIVALQKWYRKKASYMHASRIAYEIANAGDLKATDDEESQRLKGKLYCSDILKVEWVAFPREVPAEADNPKFNRDNPPQVLRWVLPEPLDGEGCPAYLERLLRRHCRFTGVQDAFEELLSGELDKYTDEAEFQYVLFTLEKAAQFMEYLDSNGMDQVNFENNVGGKDFKWADFWENIVSLEQFQPRKPPFTSKRYISTRFCGAICDTSTEPKVEL